jgi:AraC-like DNA-binding protein
MTIILDSAFATAKDTAKELGVSKARLKRLLRMVNGQASASGRTSGKKFSYKNGTRVSASARKNARGKVKKVAR